MEKIIFQSDDGTAAEFYVEEQTNIAGVTYPFGVRFTG